MFGEHVVGTDPDCKTERGLKKCSPKVITRVVSKTIVHENYNTNDNKNDIALLRLNESVPLFNENPMISAVLPVCLPWSDEELFTEDAEKVKLVSLDCSFLAWRFLAQKNKVYSHLGINKVFSRCEILLSNSTLNIVYHFSL